LKNRLRWIKRLLPRFSRIKYPRKCFQAPVAPTPKTTPTAASSQDAAAILEAIAAHGPCGKAAILVASGIKDESVYTEIIKALLAQNLITREGEKRGTKYRKA
jgi:chromosome segregation and condensation protein ScpB